MKQILSCLGILLAIFAASAQTTNTFPSSGNVGIGLTNPSSPLHIQNTARGWMITSQAQAVQPDQINGLKLMAGYIGESGKWAGIAAVAEDLHSNQTGLSLYAGASEKLRISYSGNVGIGTTTPTEKLAVNGNIRAKEIKVESTSWPDYVFDAGYKLSTIAELENYVKTNKHLPGIPNQAEVKEEGISVGEMNRKLLEKVEELTLHVIRLTKENEMQQQEIQKLKSHL